ncbi:MAG: hypothetical protein IKM11_00350 [Oscillospiraceae bacterium]|nr:hypothetical protein [Oscillospiraceae bacterium]
MRVLLFALKRALRKISYPILLVLCAGAIFLVSLDAAAPSYPPAGVCGGDGSSAAQRIMSCLTDNGFLLFDDENEMVHQVESGALDCGVTLPDDLLLRLESGEMDGCVRFVTSPLSLIPDRYRSHASAAVFREYAPYIAAAVLEKGGVMREEVLAEYEAMFAKGYAFSFEITTADEESAPPVGSDALVIGTAALLMFAVFLGAPTDDVRGNLPRRIGAKKMLLMVVLPRELVIAMLAVVAGGLGLVLAGAAQWVAPFAVYVLLLGALRIVLMAVVGERERYILLSVILLASLALCPIFTDLTLVMPPLRVVRCILPPYWLWLAADSPLICLVTGCTALIAACGLLLARWRMTDKMWIFSFQRTMNVL